MPDLSRRPSKVIASTIPVVIAGAHVRRVTLNLIRHAACCPSDLRTVLDKLAERVDWDLEALTRKEIELVFAHVTKDLADQAKTEFVADTSTIVDMERRGYPEAERHCKLCGHAHTRWEFTLRNKVGGLDAKTGSVCIEEYGLNVDGELTAEAALQKLRAAIAGAKRQAEREDWQEEHKDHAADMEFVRKFLPTIGRGLEYVEYRFVEAEWKRRAFKIYRPLKACLRFYLRQQFLTKLRTTQFYGPDGVHAQARAMDQELAKARRVIETRQAYWEKWLNHPLYQSLNYSEQDVLRYCSSYAIDPVALDELGTKRQHFGSGLTHAQVLDAIKEKYAASPAGVPVLS